MGASELGPPRQDVDMIFLYRAPLLHYWCETGEPLEDIVKNTLIHEIGHHSATPMTTWTRSSSAKNSRTEQIRTRTPDRPSGMRTVDYGSAE